MSTLIYSAIFGEYDVPKPTVPQIGGADYVMVTDSENTKQMAEERGWRVIMQDFNASDSRTKNRYYKFHPLAISKKYDLYIYLDGSAFIKSNMLVKMATSQMGCYNLMIFRHPEGRDCIYQEAVYASPMPKYRDKGLIEWAEQYRKEGMPEHFGLWACGMIVSRKSEGNDKVFEDWWFETTRGCYLDQLILPYLLWKYGHPIKTLELDQYNNDYVEFRMNEHKNLF